MGWEWKIVSWQNVRAVIFIVGGRGCLPPPPLQLNLTFCNDSLYPVTDITKAHENGETKFETSSAAWGNNVKTNLVF